MMGKRPQSNGTRKMSPEELVAIRRALRAEGIPLYPARILAAPSSATFKQPKKPSAGPKLRS